MKSIRRCGLPALLSVICYLITSGFAAAADLTITAANVIPSAAAKKDSGIAGFPIAVGNLVYRSNVADATKNKLYLADANISLDGSKVIGMALNAAGTGQRVYYLIEDRNLTIGATVAAGSIYIASSTAGNIAASADAATGWYVSTVAIGTSATTVKFKILRADVVKP